MNCICELITMETNATLNKKLHFPSSENSLVYINRTNQYEQFTFLIL